MGGQSPTLRNPPRSQAPPVWDMPSILGHADDHGLSWKAYTCTSSSPVAFYQQLQGSANIVRSDQIVADAGDLPALSMVWHDSPYDEHPVADVTLGGWCRTGWFGSVAPSRLAVYAGSGFVEIGMGRFHRTV